MSRLALLCLLVAACVGSEESTDVASSASTIAFSREHVTADIYHYEVVLPVGDAPNAAIRIHRVVREAAPFVPRRTRGAVMALHGDFSTFITNFVPVLGDPASPVEGLAPYLAARDIDVWGVDRRWTLPGATDDVSDFATMGLAQEIDDTRAALAFARSVRALGGAGADKLAVMGFSHGGQLAYAYAGVESGLAPPLRHADGIIVLDYYGGFAPDDPMRAASCEFSAIEYQLVADGVIDSPNEFLITVGTLAQTAPNEPSPFFGPATNRDALLLVVGQTYLFAPFAPFYHLASPLLDGETAIGLRESSEAAMAAWLAGATAHQAMLEAADFDRLLCAEGPQPVDAPLSRIDVPLLYVGAAGGIGDLGLYATTQVASTDVTTLVVQRFAADRRAEDFGHTDLLLGTDAPALAWQPLASWLLHH
jgi:hypothetical protein